MKRVVILARVSRGERTQDPTSQLNSLRAVAERHGWTVAAEVVKVCSAWDAKAAGDVQRDAMAPIIAGDADVLMVWSLDRLVRGGAERAFALVSQLEKHHGGALFSLQEPFLSTATADPATRELLLPIIAWVAKWESQRKSDRLTAKAGSKRASAEKLGQRALWGRGHMATSADELLVQERREAGASMRAISQETGLSVGSVWRILNANNDGRTRTEQRVQSMKAKGRTTQSISNETGLSIGSVRGILKRGGA